MYNCNILRTFGSHFCHHENRSGTNFLKFCHKIYTFAPGALHAEFANLPAPCSRQVSNVPRGFGVPLPPVASDPCEKGLVPFRQQFRNFLIPGTTGNRQRVFSTAEDDEGLKFGDLDGETLHLLVLMTATFPKEIALTEKLKLLQLVLNSDARGSITQTGEFSALMFDAGRCTGSLKREEMMIYNQACQKLSDSLWNDKSASAAGFSDEKYHQQFGIDLMTLHNESLCPTLEQYRGKYELINGLKPLLEPATGGVLHAFGSCENGLWVRGSDIDVCLRIPGCNNKQQWLCKLNLVKSLLLNCEMVSSIQIISQAMVPIAKLYNNDSANVCDVSINNTVALDNTNYVKLMAQIDHRVVKLARFIKYWATCRCINNRSQGSLSSYTLILQLFHLLQSRDPPILPKYRDIKFLFDNDSDDSDGSGKESETGGGKLERIFEACSYLRRNNESLVELLFAFFQMYSGSEFQGGYYGTTCDVYNGETNRNNLGVLVMRCPITGKNVNPFTIGMWQSIYGEFKRAYETICAKQPLAMLCQVAQRPPMHEQLQIYNENALAMHRIFTSFSPKS